MTDPVAAPVAPRGTLSVTGWRTPRPGPGAWTVAVGIAVAGGLLVATIAPHGPATTADGMAAMVIAFAVAVVGGAVTRTRWALPVVVLAGFAGVELGRLGIAAPSLAVRPDNVYGMVAMVLTRGVHGLLVVVPSAAGVLAGIALARRPDRATAGRRGRPPVGSALVGLATVALAVLVAWPSSTPPVLGPDGEPVPGSLAELSRVRLGGVDQTVMIRARDPERPVLLYLSGGPGQSDLALARALAEPWLDEVVFVTFDQRGNGTSYAALDMPGDMTLDRAVDDVIELAEHLRARFGEERVYLVGESWGTILGVLAVERRPDLFHAWIGSGQMVDILETDRRIYADLAAALEGIGEPPYRDIPWANSNMLAWYGYLYRPYTPSAGYLARGEASGLDPFGILGCEYTFLEKTAVLRGLIDTFSVMYPQLYDLDLREAASTLEVPVYVLDGVAELEGRRSLALEWFEAVEAPDKHLVTYEGAAHATAFEQADEVRHLLADTIIPATYRR